MVARGPVAHPEDGTASRHRKGNDRCRGTPQLHRRWHKRDQAHHGLRGSRPDRGVPEFLRGGREPRYRVCRAVPASGCVRRQARPGTRALRGRPERGGAPEAAAGSRSSPAAGGTRRQGRSRDQREARRSLLRRRRKCAKPPDRTPPRRARDVSPRCPLVAVIAAAAISLFAANKPRDRRTGSRPACCRTRSGERNGSLRLQPRPTPHPGTAGPPAITPRPEEPKPAAPARPAKEAAHQPHRTARAGAARKPALDNADSAPKHVRVARTRPRTSPTDRGGPRCSRIMEKATLGEPLSQDEKKELANSCR